ncbi:MAG: hypothetical protein QOF48_1272 [Verrucomicrobiota bacterium]
MVLYDPHVKLDSEEARKLKERLASPAPNPRAAETLRRARENRSL